MFTGQKGVALGRQLVVRAETTLGLARLFPIGIGDVFGSEKVRYDITQIGENMAQPVSRGGGAHRTAGDSFQEVEEVPPYINERRPINFSDLKGRAAGTTEFNPENEDHVKRLIELATGEYMKIQDSIDRQIEFQAAEILQKGKIEFSQFNNALAKDYDFLMDQLLLFLVAAPTWATATGPQKRSQIEQLMTNVRLKGKRNVTDIIAGSAANDSFWSDDDTLKRLDNRRAEVGQLAPSPLNADGFAFQGEMVFGANRVRWWLYEGFYKHPDTKVLTPYINPGSIVALAGNAERARLQGGVDIIVPSDATARQLFPGAVSVPAVADRITAVQMPYVYTDQDAVTTDIGIATAPLLLPKNRGGHGHLDTGL